METTEKRNIRRYYLRYILYSAAGALITGSIIQSFMLESGISAGLVSVYTGVIQITQAAAMILLAPRVEKARSLIRLNAMSSLGLIPMFLTVFLLCVRQGIPVNTRYLLMTAAGIIAYIAYAVIGIIEYKLPYSIIDMKHYGEVVSIAGMFIGLASLLPSVLLSFFIRRFDYFRCMQFFILAGLVLLVLSIFVGLSYEDISVQNLASQSLAESDRINKQPEKKISLFTYPPFVKLFLPNLLRGYATGTFGLMTTVGYYYGIINAESASWMAIAGYVMVMLGCVIYARMSRFRKDGWIILISSILLCLCMPLMMFTKSPVVYLLLYAAGTLFRDFVDYACPVAITYIVDYEVMGQFSSWRLALYMGGGALAGVALVPMLEHLGGPLTMMINGAAFVVMGLGYFLMMREKRSAAGESPDVSR